MLLKKYLLYTSFYLLFLLLNFASLAQGALSTIQETHPRLWWTAENLAFAKSKYAVNPFIPRSDDAFGNALKFILTGDNKFARTAINLILDLELPTQQVLPTAIGCDYCRWEGENAIIVFDWCYNEMTTNERNILINRWNKYLSDVNKQEWGGVGMEANNYYWGNLRNSLEWGIASFHHNSQAQSFIDNALKTRWQESFKPYASSFGRGGALAEGPEYGSSMISYPIIPFITLHNMGRNIYNETKFFFEAVIHTIYSTTPTSIAKDGTESYGFFSYNETAIDDLLHERTYYGDFMTTMANLWESNALGQYARQWVNLCKPTTSYLVEAVNEAGRAKNFDDLPNDYYSPGLGILYGRTNWTTSATAFQAQLKDATNVGHTHYDWGSFQIFRKGQWITRESAGYSKALLGVNSNTVQSEYPDAHNTIFVGVKGDMRSLVGYWQTARPNVKRLESQEDYTYAAVDLTDCFQSDQKPEYFENPYVDKVVREYIFIRKLETLLVFDRVKSKSQKVSSNEVIKTVLIHFETNPVIEDLNHISIGVGDQVGRVTTLVPIAPLYNIVNEGSYGQYRLEISTSGNEQSYFINTIQARDKSSENIVSTIQETDDSFQISLSHPTQGFAKVILSKSAESTGGFFGYSEISMPDNLKPLSEKVSSINVTESGPKWGDIITGIDSDSYSNENELLTIYPNPSRNHVTIKIPLSEISILDNLDFQLYDSSGKLVNYIQEEVKVEDSFLLVETGLVDLPSGVYLLRVRTPTGYISKRFILKE